MIGTYKGARTEGYMKYVIVDLEMNNISKEYKELKEVCAREIIEIGAVVMDESFVEISSFKTYVKPRFNTEIVRKIQKLTGITWDMVADAPEFEEAFKMFVQFCESIEDEYQIIEWSTNDHEQVEKEILQKEYQLSESEAALMNKWYDFQEEFGEILGLERRVSLKNALMYAGEDFVGDEHDALYDARNTAELFSITKIEAKKEKALQKVIDILHPKETCVTLGDLFDFSQFCSAV